MKKLTFISTMFFCAISFAQNPPNSVYHNDYGLTAHSYIQDGLIGMWDAKENIGWGLHSNNTNFWKDLIGNRNMELKGTYHWTDNACYFESVTGKGRGILPAQELPPSQTIQIVVYPTNMYPETSTTWKTARIMGGSYPSPNIYIYRNANGGTHFVSWDAYESNSTRAFADDGGSRAFTSYALHQHTMSHEADSPTVKYYIDGEIKHIYNNTNSETIQNGVTNLPVYFANNGGLSAGIDASYYCIRFYDHVLSEKEIAWNYMIDSIRYDLPRKWYPYMNSSWSWIDLKDEYTLYSDSSSSVPSEIGDNVVRIKNKGGYNNSTWFGHATGWKRVSGGIEGRNINGAVATNTMLRANVNMFTTSDDWNNIEFATILVTSNELASSGWTTCYVLRPNQWKAFMLYFSGVGMYYRSMQTNNAGIKITGITQDQFRQIDPMVLSVRTKAVNGEYNTKISINGTEILNTTGTVTEGVANNFQPGVQYSQSYAVMARDYCENLWWNKIPEDWDLIEKTLMLKYNAKPLTYYLPNYGKPLLGGGFGGVFTGGDTEEPEEPEEPPDEEIEESE